MTTTTPTGYVVDFKDEAELTYGDRRAIQKSMLKNVEVKEGEQPKLTGGSLFEAQEETLKIILKSIKRPDGTAVEGDLLSEVLSWKNKDDGDSVFDLVQKAMLPSPKATE